MASGRDRSRAAPFASKAAIALRIEASAAALLPAPRPPANPMTKKPVKTAAAVGSRRRVDEFFISLSSSPRLFIWSGELLLELSYPDIPKADGLALVTVRLQLNRRGVIFLIYRFTDVKGLAFQLEMV